MSQDALHKKVELSLLSAFYGRLLTENQRKMLSLYCEEDLALSEIAEEMDVSRQAVHQSISHISQRLEQLEDTLGLVKRFQAMESKLGQALAALKQNDYQRVETLIQSALALDREDNNGL